MNESLVAPAVPHAVALQDLAREPSLPRDDSALFTVVLPLVVLLVVYVAALFEAITEQPALLLRDGLGLSRSEEDVQRLSKADGQANQRHQRDVQRAGFDLLEVLPVHIAPLGGFFQRPVRSVAQSAHPSPERPLLLLETSGASVSLGRPLRLGGGHAVRPSGFRRVSDTSHVPINALTSLVPSRIIRKLGAVRARRGSSAHLTGAEGWRGS